MDGFVGRVLLAPQHGEIVAQRDHRVGAHGLRQRFHGVEEGQRDRRVQRARVQIGEYRKDERVAPAQRVDPLADALGLGGILRCSFHNCASRRVKYLMEV